MDSPSPRQELLMTEEKNVNRIKKYLPDKYRDLCYMHLSFILNLSDDKLEFILDDAPSAGKKKLVLAPLFKRKVKLGMCLFGAPLSSESISLTAPLFKFLSLKENISKEGLFRKPGNRQRMRSLREELIAQGPGLVIDTSVYNSYDVAGVLKEFLRDLPEPLLSDKHMEAHRQLNALGQHAKSAEDQSRYVAKKLSGLQILIQLMPTPFHIMTKQVLTLLHDVSKTSITKMTPRTLATIFAPIFFLDRKVAAVEVCDAVKEVEPALTYMIENCKKLFKVPKELAVDVSNYWKEIEGTPNDIQTTESNSKLSQSYKIKKSISGRTLNTAICYIDREYSKNVDVASNTQVELKNLFAHVNSLPDTPGNQHIKDLMARRSQTPLSSGKRHTRSKSISASIRKMVPSLAKSKAKSLDMSVQSNSTPYSDTKALKFHNHQSVTDCKVMVVNCSSRSKKQLNRKLDLQEPKHLSDISVMTELLNSPAHITLSSTTTTIAQSISLFTKPASYRTPPHTPLTRKRVHADNQSSMQDPTPPKQECIEKAVPPSHSDSQNLAPLSSIQGHKSLTHNASSASFCNSTQKDCPVNLKKRSLQQSSSLPSLTVATPQEIKDTFKSPKLAGESENEINYLPSAHHGEKSYPSISTNDINSPLSRRPLRPCNGPGTPIMRRAVLQIPCYQFETSL